MARANPKPQSARGMRNVLSPHTGKEAQIPGTKAGKKRAMRQYGDPDRTHDGPKYRSNPKRFENKKKLGIYDTAEQLKKTQTPENPYN